MKYSKAWFFEKAFRLSLISLFVFSLFCTLHSETRSNIRGALLKDYRLVLSTVQGDLQGDGTIFTVAKIKTRNSLSLEIYTGQENEEKLIEVIELGDKRDGYFNFKGEAINLAIEDIDNNGQPVILAPTFDNDLVGHLNVFHYDSHSGHFANRRKLIQN